ncbi:MAG: AbrB/MazE/SpoVT family DNA-binding domain-containing protein [Candidatus Sulfotelmatobacter sp.]
MALDEDNDRRSSVISTRGRITIPAHLRKGLDLKPGGTLLVTEANGRLVFTPLRVKSGRKVPKSRSLLTGR